MPDETEMARTTYHRPDDIDLGALWRSAVRSLPRLTLIALALAAATYGVLALVAPRYMSEAQLAIESKSAANPFADPSRSGMSDSVSVRMDKEAINTHVRALMSTDLGEEIVREMRLAERPEFNSARGSPDTLSALLRLVGIGAPRASESDQDRALDAYFRSLEVYSPRESRFIGVRFRSIDPELAAAVANRIAETYRRNIAHQSLIETDDVQKALEPKIARLADEAAAAEAAAAATRAALDAPPDPPPPTSGARRGTALAAAAVLGLVLVGGSLIGGTGLANAVIVNQQLAAAQAAEQARQARISELLDAVAAASRSWRTGASPTRRAARWTSATPSSS